MENTKHLYILWTSNVVETFDEMVYMYAFNAKKSKWWDKITLIIWGASAKLAGEDKLVQQKLKELIQQGVEVSACKACASNLGVAASLEGLGVEVVYWGSRLTQVLQSDDRVITV